MQHDCRLISLIWCLGACSTDFFNLNLSLNPKSLARLTLNLFEGHLVQALAQSWAKALAQASAQADQIEGSNWQCGVWIPKKIIEKPAVHF